MNRKVLVAALVAAFAMLPAAGQSTEQKVRFSIPAQPAAKALDAYARQANVQIVFPHDLASAVEAKPVVGEFTRKEAVSRLLEGTGLTAEPVSEGVIAIRGPNGAKGNATNPLLLAQASEGDRAGASEEETRRKSVTRVEVTGSRIRRTETEGPSPLIVLDRAQIEATGETSLGGILRMLPQNSSAEIDFRTSTLDGSSTTSNRGASVNLRALGRDSTLVLLNGRRITKTGLDAGYVDISFIPASLVQRIEILTDGASAIYGSDAVAGVVNIILRKDYQGVEVGVRGSTTSEGGYSDQTFHAAGGTSWRSGQAYGGLELYRQSNLETGERSFTGNGDWRGRGGQDFRSLFASPGNIVAVDGFLNQLGVATTAARPQPIPAGQNGRGLRISDFVPGAEPNRSFSFARGSLVPPMERASVYLGLEQQLGLWTLFADVIAGRRRTDPSSSDPILTGRIEPGSAFNPFNEPVTISYSAINEAGPLINLTTTRTANINAGAMGELGGRRYVLTLSAGRETVDTRIGPIRDILQATAILNRTDPARVYNVWGDGSANSSAVIAEMFALSQDNVAKAYSRAAELLVEGDFLRATAWEFRAAAGVQHRKEGFDTRFVFAPISVTVRSGDRDATAVFGEVLVPLLRKPSSQRLELTAAARLEDYSDSGRSTDPKVGLVWAPLPDLLVRTSWGTSFKAPLLRQLYDPPTTFNNVVNDPLRGGERATIPQTGGGNPDLGPENAKTWTAGVIYEPKNTGLALSLSFYRILYEDRVMTPSLLEALVNEAAYPGVLLRAASCPGDLRAPPCPYVGIDVRPRNFSVVRMRGLDVGASYAFPLAGARMTLSGAVAYVNEYKTKFTRDTAVIDALGTIGNPPKLRSTAGLGMVSGRLTANLQALYNHRYKENSSATARPIASYTTVNVNGRYKLPDSWTMNARGLSVIAGVNNVFNPNPPFANSPWGFDPSVVDPRGRTYFVGVNAEW